MTGIEIPIGGDMAPFLAVAADLRAAMAKIGSQARGALRPAKQDSLSLAQSMRKAWESTKGASGGMRVLRTGVASIGPAFRSLGRAATSVLSGIRNSVNGLSGSIGSMKGKLTGGLSLGPLAGIAGGIGAAALAITSLKTGAEIAGGFERTTIALEQLTGSGDEARRVLNEMKATWEATGVTVADQAATIQKFIALGFSPDDAIKLQKNILDVAGATGMSATEAELLGSALAQVKAKGIVSMEELRQQIAEKGVPVFEVLAQKMGVTQGELMKLVEDGKVPAQNLLDIFLNMEGAFGRFSGGAARMGGTFLGMLSRLRAQWNLLLAEFAAPIIDSLKPLLADGIAFMASLKASAASAGKAVGDALLAVFALIKTGRTQELLFATFNFAIQKALDVLTRGLRGAVAFLATALPPVFEAAVAIMKDPMFWQGLGRIFQGLGQSLTAEIYRALGDLNRAKAAQAGSDMNLKQGGQMIAKSGGGISVSKLIVDALREGSLAALEAAGNMADSKGLTDSREALKSLLQSVSKEVAAMRAGVAAPAPTGAPGAFTAATGGIAETTQKAFQAITTSLGKVGGGGGFVSATPALTEARKGNSLLKRIEENTRKFAPMGEAIA